MITLKGKRPQDLGVRDGRFTAARSWKPNWVSSQVDPADPHHIAPLKFSRDPKAAMQRLGKVVAAQPRTVILKQDDVYLSAECSTAGLGFTDDVEFLCDGAAIQVRSCSRLGIRDFGVNRKRIEALRAEFERGS